MPHKSRYSADRERATKLLHFKQRWAQFQIDRALKSTSQRELIVEEFLRWGTSIHNFRRTATVDTEVRGRQIKAGDKVVVYYMSANYDEDVFDEPNKFNILRNPNPHLGFGGNGTHHCIGANLARMEIALMFDAIADVIPDIAKISDPTRVRSPWLNGLKTFEVDYR